MLLRLTASHVKLVKSQPAIRSIYCCFEDLSHFKLVNPASGDISDMLLSLRLRRSKVVTLQAGIHPICPDRQNTVLSNPLNLPKVLDPIYLHCKNLSFPVLLNSPRVINRICQLFHWKTFFRLINPASGDRSDMVSLVKANHSRLISPATGDRSDTLIPANSKPFRLINPAIGDRSETNVVAIHSSVRFIKFLSEEIYRIWGDTLC